MKQFHIAYKEDESFRKELEAIRQWCAEKASYTVLFRIYSEDMELAHIRHVCDILDEQMPEALYLGCTTQGNILEGAFAKTDITLTCTVFEYETTRVKLLQVPFTEENEKEAVHQLKAYCDENPWVSAVEMYATMLGLSVRAFCGEMSTLRDDVQVFGGGACNPDANDFTTIVFSKGNGFSDRGIVFLLLGGRDFHVYSTFVSGWKPLRRKFKITKAHRDVLYELDGKPAFQVYQRFLNISRSDLFVTNTLEFPLFMDHKGIDVLRCPLVVNEDDSLLLTSEVAEGMDVRLAYGDPKTILSSILHDGQNIADFRPEVIQTFSCAARRAFWGDENISNETTPFNKVAPTSGFYTGGELLRINGDLRHFNITLVFAAMREGEAEDRETVDLYDARHDREESERITLIRRFVSFIEASTADFEELNQKLMVASITDGLTRLYNRAEIERKIRGAVEEREQKRAPGALSLVMLDIDNFKRINDVYGHKEGDQVIIALANVLREVMSGVENAAFGRWGGEEFMVLLPDYDVCEASALAEKMRLAFASISYEAAGSQTVSIGVAQAKAGEDADELYRRVDKALYTAKAGGKNQVVRLD